MLVIPFFTVVVKIKWAGLPRWSSGKESTGQSRGCEFSPWSRKIPRAVEQLSLYATTCDLHPEPTSCNCWSPCAPEPVPPTREASPWEACASQLGKAWAQQGGPGQAQIKIKFYKRLNEQIHVRANCGRMTVETWASLVAQQWRICLRCRRLAGDTDPIPGSGISPRERNDNLSCDGKSHGQKSLEGYSPWGHKDLLVEQLNNNTES